ncbi:MAG: single-stranded DNA-binding protein [Acidimicrobiia bacterium]
MDLNLVVLAGHIAAEPEVRVFTSGATLIRYLVTVRSTEPRRRVDVIPVSLWDPPDELVDCLDVRGKLVWVVGAVQRRFWSTDGDTRSRIEVIAHQVNIREPEIIESDEEPSAA